IDVALENRGGTALKVIGEILSPTPPKPMREAMRLNGVEAFEVENGFDEPVCCRITVDGRDNVGAERIAKLRLIFERIRIRLPNQFAGDIRMIEPFRDTMYHRVFETIVVQDRGIDVARKLGFAPYDFFGLFTNAMPDRIDCRYRLCDLG